LQHASTDESNQYDEILTEVLQTNCSFTEVGIKELREKGIRLPISFGRSLMIDNTKLVEASKVEFKSFRESIVDMVAYYNKGIWKECSIKLDEDLEQKFLK